MTDDMDHSKLQLTNMIGFTGAVANGLHVHPARQCIIYPVGTTVVIENISTKKQEFLSGHTNMISCIDVSNNGNLIASGQITFTGFKADVIVWDFESRQEYCRLTLHRNLVEALAFSGHNKFLITLGGVDDASVVVWNLARKEAVCGSPAQLRSAGVTYCLSCANNVDEVFATGGRNTLRVWHINAETRKVLPTDIPILPHSRVIRCLFIDHEDKYLYCGTTSGDVFIVNMATSKFIGIQPREKQRYKGGITAITYLFSGHFIVGTGDGLVSVCDAKFNRTSHCSAMIVSCGYEEIRVWVMKTKQERLRIVVPNMTCNSVALTPDGSSIISGWSDCRIRVYFPESGRLMYMVDQAYGTSVTVVAAYNNCAYIVSGSDLGHVVVWQVPRRRQTSDVNQATKHFLLKEHYAAVTCIKLKADDSNCVTTSIDGTCIIWDLNQRSRLQMMRLNSLFKSACYHPLEHQVLTSGSDHHISFWETFDGSILRHLEAALVGSVNSVDVSRDGAFLVSGGDDKIVKLWRYEEGLVTHVGLGHSASIVQVGITPDQQNIVSISTDGAILIWTFPSVLVKELVPEVTATNPRMLEAQLAPIYDEEGDDDLVPDDVNKEFVPMLEEKGGIILSPHESCLEPQE